MCGILGAGMSGTSFLSGGVKWVAISFSGRPSARSAAMPLAVSMELPPPTLTNASADASAACFAATAMESVGECGFTVS